MNSVIDDISPSNYLFIIRDLQTKCAAFSWARVPALGEKAPAALDGISALLFSLERMATCVDGCHGGDHHAEILIGRVVTLAQAGLLLMSHGYYDECLSNVRSLGEIGNLISMFAFDKERFELWKSLNETDRRREFSAVRVRIWLEANEKTLVVSRDRYELLSSYGVHPNTLNMPQAHNQFGLSHIGPSYQEAGFLLCINEIALPLAFIGLLSCHIITVTKAARSTVKNIALNIGDNIGAISIQVKGRPWFQLN